MAPPSKTKFQIRWKSEFPWVKEKGLGNATCTVCNRDILYESMGRSAFKSHEKGAKHIDNIANVKKSFPVSNFFKVSTAPAFTSTSVSTSITNSAIPVTSSSHITPSSSCHIQSTLVKQGPSLMDRFKIKEETIKAEVLWCLHSVTQHLSLRGSESSIKIMKMMFPDSEIASNVKLGKDKISYSVVYGLAPFFEKLSRDLIKESKTFVVGFDESLNKISQTQQMDVSVRFWNESTDRVSVRYLTSIFLTKGRAVDLLEGLKEALAGFDIKKMLQLSMDGPNVNLKLINLLKKELCDREEDPKLLDIGTCGLHVVSGAFKTGITKTGWELIALFRALYYLFKDSPTRRGIFITVTGCDKFPLKFCSVRWVENVIVAKRALEVFPHVVKYIEKVSGTENEPKCNSFKTIRRLINDPLLIAKITFFQALAEDLQPFLLEFQSEAPMTPFLHATLTALLKTIMERFVKPEVILKQPLKYINVFEKQDNVFTQLKRVKDIDLGYSTRAALRKCKDLKQLDNELFRKDCRICLQHLTGKILEKSPLKYPLTEGLSFLNPNKIAVSKESAYKNMTVTLETMMSSNLLPATTIENADREYKSLISSGEVDHKLVAYNRGETRVDDFWVEILHDKRMENLKTIVKMLLPMSHGNASLERGFSVNGELLVENLKNESIVAQRLVYDAVSNAGGIDKVDISKGLAISMNNANARWKSALEARKRKMTEKEEEVAKKRKALVLAKELEEKKIKLIQETEQTVAKMNKEIEDLKN